MFDKFVAALKQGARSAEDRRAGSSRHRPGAADQPGTPRQGAVVLRARRWKRAPPWSPAAACPTCRRTRDGAWIEPTIWTGLPDDATVCREEIFGPCCHIVPFDSEDEVDRGAPTTPATAWPPRSGPPTSQRGHRVAPHRSRPGLGQQLVPARSAHAVRRRQAIRYRPRGRRALARVLHRAEKRLHQVVSMDNDNNHSNSATNCIRRSSAAQRRAAHRAASRHHHRRCLPHPAALPRAPPGAGRARDRQEDRRDQQGRAEHAGRAPAGLRLPDRRHGRQRGRGDPDGHPDPAAGRGRDRLHAQEGPDGPGHHRRRRAGAPPSA